MVFGSDETLEGVTARLARAGFLAPGEDAAALHRAAGGDRERLGALVARRVAGEPLAWITGTASFCGVDLRVDRGVYVPRSQTERLARLAVAHLPLAGAAIDVCTGSGAVAAVLRAHHPDARIVATDVDDRSVACARANGVDARLGDLFEPVPDALRGNADVVVAVVPYVPTGALDLLQRDTFAFESTLAYDGGEDGTDVLRRVVVGARAFLRPLGRLLLELGGDQTELLAGDLDAYGYDELEILLDDEGDVRGLVARFDT
jgi:release factor glutamine methyltransferase